jgi:hypothetical protein
MKIKIHADTKIRVNISIAELSIRFIWIQKIIIISGIQMAIHELNKNLHLIIVCLNSHLNVNPKFDSDNVMLFTTASHAE